MEDEAITSWKEHEKEGTGGNRMLLLVYGAAAQYVARLE
jgi:hypothetical protein